MALAQGTHEQVSSETSSAVGSGSTSDDSPISPSKVSPVSRPSSPVVGLIQPLAAGAPRGPTAGSAAEDLSPATAPATAAVNVTAAAIGALKAKRRYSSSGGRGPAKATPATAQAAVRVEGVAEKASAAGGGPLPATPPASMTFAAPSASTHAVSHAPLLGAV